jgi:hypothetical protein
LNANLKTGFTNRKANQEYEKQGLHPNPKRYPEMTIKLLEKY